MECCKNDTRKCSIAAAIKRQHEEQEASTSTKIPPRTRARVSELFVLKTMLILRPRIE